MRFLVVHGLPQIREAVRKLLLEIEPRAEVKTAEWGEEGLELDISWHPDAIFIGLVFGRDQRDVATMQKLLAAKPARPVVLCTVLPQSDPHVIQAMSMGAFAYVPQPMPKGALRETLALLEPAIGTRKRIR